MVKGFKEFIMRGNVIDLAVGVVIGAAFNALITQLTKSFIEPLIRLIGGGGKVAGTFTVNDVAFDWGAFVSAAITFLLTAAALYFFVVAPFNALRERRERGNEADVELSNEEKMVALLERIADQGPGSAA